MDNKVIIVNTAVLAPGTRLNGFFEGSRFWSREHGLTVDLEMPFGIRGRADARITVSDDASRVEVRWS